MSQGREPPSLATIEQYKDHLFNARRHVLIVEREGTYFAVFSLSLLLSGNGYSTYPLMTT